MTRRLLFAFCLLPMFLHAQQAAPPREWILSLHADATKYYGDFTDNRFSSGGALSLSRYLRPLGKDGALLSGEPLRDAVDAVRPHGPVAMLVNCVSARDMHVPLALLLETAAVPAGCYANVGPPLAHGTHMRHDVASGEHENAAARWAAMGARIVGGCCGTTPELLARIAGRLAPLPPDMIAAGIHRHAPLPPDLAAALAAHHASTLVEGEPSA